MTPYFLLLSIPSFLALYYRKRNIRVAFFIVFLIFVLFVGLRYRVGPDWPVYEQFHLSLRRAVLGKILTWREPLSTILFWLSQNYGFDMLLSNIVAAVILLFGVFSFARRTLNPWLAIVAATPYLIIAFGMAGIRQAMSVGVMLYVFSQWEKSSLLRRIAGTVVALLFHTSAIIGSFFVVYVWSERYKRQVKIWTRIIVGSILGLLIFYLSKAGAFLESYETYQQRYLNNPSAVVSLGSSYHIALIIIPAILGYIYKSRIRNLVPNYDLMMLGIFGALGLLVLNMISTTAASRLTLYFYFIPMMVYPALTFAFGRRNRTTLTAMVVLAQFMVLAAWLLYANNSSSHIPYRNILFEAD